MKAAPQVQVKLAEGTDSGLAHIVEQYLRQDLEESEGKRRQAARLRGRLALTATDHDVTVTVEFRGEEIEIWDGERPPLDASIAGPHLRLTKLLTGEAHPLWEHLRGRLRVRARWRRPLLPLHVHNLMKIREVKEGQHA